MNCNKPDITPPQVEAAKRIKVIKRPDSEALRRQEISLMILLIRRHPERAKEAVREMHEQLSVK